MISDVDIARQIKEIMLDIFRQVDESLAKVKKSCPPEEAAAYSKAVGHVAGAIVMDVLGPLYKKQPTLKPPQWDE